MSLAGAESMRLTICDKVLRVVPEGNQTMDYNGVPGRGFGPGSNEGWRIRRNSYFNHSSRSAERTGLST